MVLGGQKFGESPFAGDIFSGKLLTDLRGKHRQIVFDRLPLSVPAVLVPHLISFFPLESDQLIKGLDVMARRCRQPEWIPIRICIL